MRAYTNQTHFFLCEAVRTIAIHQPQRVHVAASILPHSIRISFTLANPIDRSIYMPDLNRKIPILPKNEEKKQYFLMVFYRTIFHFIVFYIRAIFLS